MSAAVSSRVAAQIFSGKVTGSQAGLPSPTLYAKTCLYAAFTAALSVIHMPSASAPEPGASGASLYQSTLASPAWRPSLRSSGSSPPSPLPSPGLTGAPPLEPEGFGSSLWPATDGFLSSSSPPEVTAQTLPPMTSRAATAAAIARAGLPLNGLREPYPPGGGVPGAPGYCGCCG